MHSLYIPAGVIGDQDPWKDHNDCFLMELVSEELEPISFRGSEKDQAVLCTPTQTFKLDRVQLTNPFLSIVVSNSDFVLANQFWSYLEPVEIPPRIHQIPQVLSDSLYSGPETWSRIAKRSKDDLREQVQASDLELDRGLAHYSAVEIDGFYCRFCPQYLSRGLLFLFALIDKNGWDFTGLDKTKLCILLETLDSNYPACTNMKLLDQVGAGSDYSFDGPKVSRILGEELLKSKSRWTTDEFIKEWRNLVPEAFALDLSALQVDRCRD